MNPVTQTPKLNPAYGLIRKFDRDEKRGEDLLSERLRIARSTVQRWAYPRDRGGTGGYVPTWYHDKILELAEELGRPVDHADFFRMPRAKSSVESVSA